MNTLLCFFSFSEWVEIHKLTVYRVLVSVLENKIQQMKPIKKWRGNRELIKREIKDVNSSQAELSLRTFIMKNPYPNLPSVYQSYCFLCSLFIK